MNFEESVDYMSSLLTLGIKLGKDRFEALLGLVGLPHTKLKAVHIAGTKGKGSTATFATSILRAAGYSVGTYLSPFVYNLRERIQVDGEMIPKADFARIVTDLKPHIDALAATEHGMTTEFELKTAVGLIYFAERKVDYAVIEVGLGGRLDATNVIPAPLVSVITNIGFDHVEYLGNTLGLIAAEKAGIIKQGGLCVTGIAGDEAMGVVEKISAQRDARLVKVSEGSEWRSENDRSLSICANGLDIKHAQLRLRGRFQHANAALASIALAESEITNITSETVREGIETATLPGRFEVVQSHSPMIVMDVAHNELAAAVLRDALIEEAGAANRPVVLVVGVSRTHDPADLLTPLVHGTGTNRVNIHTLIATQPEFRPRAIEDIVDVAKELGLMRIETSGSVTTAATRALEVAKTVDDALIVVTGSFYTVGELPSAVWRDLLSPQAVGV